MDDSISDQSLNVSDAYCEDKFCSGQENIERCARYLHHELHTIGLPSVLDRETHKPDIVRLLNTIHRLLQLRRSDHLTIEELRTSLQRGRSDVTMQIEIRDRLKDDLRVADKELASSQEKERQLNMKIKSLSSKLRAEQDEVRRLKSSMQYKDTQHSHEMRKREKEYTRLKTTLGQMLSDRTQQRRLGLSVLNALQRTGGKRKLWNQSTSSVEDTYRAIVSSYEERQKAMLVENGSLRESLSAMQREFVSLLNEQQTRSHKKQLKTGEEEEEGEILTEEDYGGLSSGHFQMPYDIVRDGIEKTFREHLQKLREQLQHTTSQTTHAAAVAGDRERDEGSDDELSSNDDVESLQNKLSDYRDIIKRQEELLQNTSSDHHGDNSGTSTQDHLSESWIWREKERLLQDRAVLQEHRDNLEKDRMMMIEAAKNLDRERQTFEDDKVAFLKEQLDGSVFNNTTELDSFFNTLSSTPATHHPPTTTSLHMCCDGSTTNVDLNHDLSLCSDDGLTDVVLNDDRPSAT